MRLLLKRLGSLKVTSKNHNSAKTRKSRIYLNSIRSPLFEYFISNFFSPFQNLTPANNKVDSHESRLIKQWTATIRPMPKTRICNLCVSIYNYVPEIQLNARPRELYARITSFHICRCFLMRVQWLWLCNEYLNVRATSNTCHVNSCTITWVK